MKKLTALLLSTLLLILSFPCMAENTPSAEIDLDFFKVTASFITEKNYGELTARITKKQATPQESVDRTVYALDQKSGTKTENGYTYNFLFKLPATATSGTYILSVGGAYNLTQEFSYFSVIDKIQFFNDLNAAPVTATDNEDTVCDLLGADKCKASYDLTLYHTLRESVRALVDIEIASLDLYSTQETVMAKEQSFINKMDELLPLALLLNVTAQTDNQTLDNLVAMGKEAGLLDVTGYAALPHTYALQFILQEMPSVLEQEIIANAFSRAVLLANVKVMDASTVANIFDYYKQKGIVTVDETNYQQVDKESLFEAVKEMNNPDITSLQTNVDAVAAQLLADDPVGEDNPGDGIGGTDSTGGIAGGGGGGAAFSGDADKTPAIKEEIEPVKFNDLDTVPWANLAILRLAGEGILSGKDKGVFAPNDSMSREELVKLIVLAFGGLDENAEITFKDVSKGRWSYPYIASAYQLELVNGVNEMEFAPNAFITRQDMATILYRVLEKTGDAKSGSLDFKDASSISSYAKQAVGTLTAIGAINGMGDGTFAPKGYVTRAQAAKVVYEMMQYIGGDKA